jgi:endonuclease-8
MPEGDTIHRAAAALRATLVDQKMVRFEAPRLVGITPRAGRTIESVESHGKHVEVQWDDGVILHTNMRMSGSWHLYRSGASWQEPHRHMRALIEVEGWRAVCFNAPVVETYRVPDALRHPGLGGLGPDLSRSDADLHRCIELLQAHDDPDTTVAEVLLDQRVFCGLGNVFRCEVLWAGQLSPFARVAALPHRDAVRLVNVAATVVRANLSGGSRHVIPGAKGGLAVYGRVGQPCRRCGDSVASRRTAEHARVLYWCPGCQVRFDPRRSRLDDTQWLDEPKADRHPAARKFSADASRRRTG